VSTPIIPPIGATVRYFDTEGVEHAATVTANTVEQHPPLAISEGALSLSLDYHGAIMTPDVVEYAATPTPRCWTLP